jgi:hypothetical protein
MPKTAVQTDRSDPDLRHRRRGDLAGTVGAVAIAKRPQQAWPDTPESLARESLKLAARWLPRGLIPATLIALVPACLVLLVSPVVAANNSVDGGNKHSIDRYNQLQLRAEQKTYQQSVEPLSPVDQQTLKQKMNQQRLQQHNLQLRQDQSLQGDRYRHRINPGEPYRVNRPGLSTQSQQQQQRLQMRMQRNTWSYPRN